MTTQDLLKRQIKRLEALPQRTLGQDRLLKQHKEQLRASIANEGMSAKQVFFSGRPMG